MKILIEHVTFFFFLIRGGVHTWRTPTPLTTVVDGQSKMSVTKSCLQAWKKKSHIMVKPLSLCSKSKQFSDT